MSAGQKISYTLVVLLNYFYNYRLHSKRNMSRICPEFDRIRIWSKFKLKNESKLGVFGEIDWVSV